jgi:hypothetical protein
VSLHTWKVGLYTLLMLALTLMLHPLIRRFAVAIHRRLGRFIFESPEHWPTFLSDAEEDAWKELHQAEKKWP